MKPSRLIATEYRIRRAMASVNWISPPAPRSPADGGRWRRYCNSGSGVLPRLVTAVEWDPAEPDDEKAVGVVLAAGDDRVIGALAGVFDEADVLVEGANELAAVLARRLNLKSSQ